MGMAGDNMENNSLPNGDFEKSMDIEVYNQQPFSFFKNIFNYENILPD